MALQHLRSSTANKRPTPAAMSDGQLAMNTNLASPGLFLKDSNGDLVKIGPVHVGTTAPNATPGAGGQAGNSVGEQWLDTTGGRFVFKIWDGTAFRTEDGEFVNATGDTMTGALGIIAGSAATPSVFFTGDTNTGIFSPGADQVAISTNGTGRLSISSAGEVTTTNEKLNLITVGRGAGAVSSNTAVGSGALQANTTGIQNTANGLNALFSNTTGINNTATGLDALRFNTTGSFNTANGVNALLSNTTGINNTANGLNALFSNTTGSSNTANGFQALFSNTTGIQNTANGLNALFSNTTGGSNTCYGNTAGQNLTTGSNNTIIGTILGTAGLANTVIIGAGSTERLRIDSSGNVGIGTSAPQATLHTNGAILASGALAATSASNIFFDQPTSVLSRIGVVGANTSTAGTLRISQYSSNGSVGRDVVSIDNAGNVGIGTTSPTVRLEINGASAQVRVVSSTVDMRIIPSPGGNAGVFGLQSNHDLVVRTNATERARIDTSGRLLVGTSTSRAVSDWAGNGPQGLIQIEAANSGAIMSIISAGTADAQRAGTLSLGRHRNSTVGGTPTVVQSGDALGAICFAGGDGADMLANGASIRCEVDGAPGTDDMPGRLVFSTTADGLASPTERMRISANGNVNVVGALSKGSGSFRIDHPLPEKKDTHHLIHSFIEGPQADLIYRGHVDLINGIAQVNIDVAGRMTEGTFKTLCTNVCCFTSNETDWTPVRGHVDGNILNIEAQDPTSTAEVCWMVIGERKDQHMLDTNWTDENGRVITEPLKEVTPSVTQ